MTTIDVSTPEARQTILEVLADGSTSLASCERAVRWLHGNGEATIEAAFARIDDLEEAFLQERSLARDLYLTLEVRTDFGHMRHDGCTPGACDETFRRKTLARAAGVLP